MRILVINPGSTSTKVAVYEDEHPLVVSNIRHTAEELQPFKQAIEQHEFRKQLVLDWLEENGHRTGIRRHHRPWRSGQTYSWRCLPRESENVL